MKLNMKATADGPQFVIGTEIACVRLFALKLKVMFPIAQIAPLKKSYKTNVNFNKNIQYLKYQLVMRVLLYPDRPLVCCFRI